MTVCLAQVGIIDGDTKLAFAQDILRLDNSARMNLPGSTTNNWSWRMGDSKVWAKLNKHTEEIQQWLKDYDRTQETTVV